MTRWLAIVATIAGCGDRSGCCGSDAIEVDRKVSVQGLLGPYSSPDLDVEWDWHAMVVGVGTPPKAGADGMSGADINGDGLLDWVSGWEEGSSIYVAIHPGYGLVESEWPHVRVDGNPSAEDAMFADVDGDGRIDVVSGGEGERLKVAFAPADNSDLLTAGEWTTISIGEAEDIQDYMQLAFADVDGNGLGDIIVGGRDVGALDGTLGWWDAPADPRVATGWTSNTIADVEWAMTVDVADYDGDGDTDVAVSDRSGAIKGVRWHENDGAGGTWTLHAISDPGPGTVRMVAFDDINGDGLVDLIDGATGSAGAGANVNSISTATAVTFESWSTSAISDPAGVGDYHSASVCDVDRDGIADLVFSYSSAESAGESGVVWMRQDPLGTFTRGEISGDLGEKYDNTICHDVDGDGDLDIVTSEQNDNLGMGWFENPSVDP